MEIRSITIAILAVPGMPQDFISKIHRLKLVFLLVHLTHQPLEIIQLLPACKPVRTHILQSFPQEPAKIHAPTNSI